MTQGIMYDVLRCGKESVRIDVFAEYDPDLLIESVITSDINEADDLVLRNERNYVYISTL